MAALESWAAGNDVDWENVAFGASVTDMDTGPRDARGPTVRMTTCWLRPVTFLTDSLWVTVPPLVTASGESDAVTARPLAVDVELVASAVEAVAAKTARATRAPVDRRARESDSRMRETSWKGDWAIPQSVELRDIGG
jgi:hypothetical protein